MEKDADAQGVGEQRRTLGGWSTTLALRMSTEYDAGAEEDHKVRR